jgi:hypothetical protein
MNAHSDPHDQPRSDSPAARPGAGRSVDAKIDSLLRTYAASFEATPALEAKIRAIAADGRRRWPRQWARLGLVAASFGVVAVAGAYLIVGPRARTVVGIAEPISSLRQSVVLFLWGQHQRCGMSEEAAAAKFPVHSLDRVIPEFSAYLSATPDLEGLERCGLRFRGAGRCAVPGREPSIHLMFDSDGRSEFGDVEVSVFIQAAGGSLPLEPGRTYSLVALKAGGSEGEDADTVLAWKSNGLVYFVVCRSPLGRVVVARVLRAPSESGQL